MRSIGRSIYRFTSNKPPLGLLVIVISILPLLVFEWRPINAARSHQTQTSLTENTTIPFLPITPVEERDFPPPRFTKNVKVRKGDTLIALFKRHGMKPGDAHQAIKVLSKYYDPRRIRPGQEINLEFTPQSSKFNDHLIERVVVHPTIFEEITVDRINSKRFKASKRKLAVKRSLFKASGTIKTSLYMAAINAGVPAPVLMELIRIYSWDVDFQRGVRAGDRFEVMFERRFSENGEFTDYGKILFGNLILSGEQNSLYRYTTTRGLIDYFDKNGQSARKALMRTPINGARLTSGFGKRRHPILGYNKIHRGVDFAAPTGTPIYAAGKGLLIKRGRNGAYGNYIRIRHNSLFETAYGHLSRFHRGIRLGTRVRQGQIIGYVGTTGRSTGPHLHYEVFKKKRHVNPMRLKMPSGLKLVGKELARFLSTRAELDKEHANLTSAIKLTKSIK